MLPKNRQRHLELSGQGPLAQRWTPRIHCWAIDLMIHPSLRLHGRLFLPQSLCCAATNVPGIYDGPTPLVPVSTKVPVEILRISSSVLNQGDGPGGNSRIVFQEPCQLHRVARLEFLLVQLRHRLFKRRSADRVLALCLSLIDGAHHHNHDDRARRRVLGAPLVMQILAGVCHIRMHGIERVQVRRSIARWQARGRPGWCTGRRWD